LTTAQITQFIVGGGSALLHLFVYYKYPSTITDKASANSDNDVWVPCLDTSAQAFAVWFNVIYLTPLTYLFARFFVRSYLRTNNGANKSNVRSTLQAAERASKEAVADFSEAEVLEDTSANGRTSSRTVKANSDNLASRKGY
jgi:hypothetical protein